MLHTTNFYYFSPTGGTKKVGKIFCKAISENVKESNLGDRHGELVHTKGDLTVVAAPVYAGRIPSVAAEKLRSLKGQGEKAVVLAVYGNRAYDDALLEMAEEMEQSGFTVIAGGGFVAQHSLAPEVGEGRPDAEDQRQICEFAEKVLEKVAGGSETKPCIPGNHPYKEVSGMPATPVSLSGCCQCGVCEKVCPTGAIQNKDGEMTTDLEKCILCMACVSACPNGARILPPQMQEAFQEKLGALKEIRGKNEWFL